MRQGPAKRQGTQGETGTWKKTGDLGETGDMRCDRGPRAEARQTPGKYRGGDHWADRVRTLGPSPPGTKWAGQLPGL